MPMLEQYYNGKLVHSLEISFEGLDTAEERAFHIQGLCECGTGNFEKEMKRPFVRPKADHTNPNWLE